MSNDRIKEDSRKRRTINHDPLMEDTYRKLLESQGWKPRSMNKNNNEKFNLIYATISVVMAVCLYIWISGLY